VCEIIFLENHYFSLGLSLTFSSKLFSFQQYVLFSLQLE
jgi:hypothetical protein